MGAPFDDLHAVLQRAAHKNADVVRMDDLDRLTLDTKRSGIIRNQRLNSPQTTHPFFQGCERQAETTL